MRYNLTIMPEATNDQPQGATPIADELTAIPDMAETPEERMSLEIDVLRRLFRGDLKYEAMRIGELREYETGVESGVFEAELPGMPVGMKGIRETKGTFYATDRQSFFHAEQGRIIEVPIAANPRFYLGMSECSMMCAIDRTKDEPTMLVAHVAFSEKESVDAVTQLFNERGIPPEDRYVIASIGKFQNERSEGRRVTRKEDYVARGFMSENIIDFEYVFEPSDDPDQASTHKNVIELSVSADGMGFEPRDISYGFNGGRAVSRILAVGEVQALAFS